MLFQHWIHFCILKRKKKDIKINRTVNLKIFVANSNVKAKFQWKQCIVLCCILQLKNSKK
ncbi:hypothetical protein BpHYR1_022304 [Brachionus plicatilis]|uniref:Uncharacterized protein n=1 Tax=Brachionus plicatilis TaxID=10195 RepID=A0A3M7QFC9_BRAPC|nr:hypothetical protein BpHYR1_022304 [Brachionus plicatilis]